jgi:NitT/TauT family transport system substrate-binding protein
MIRSLIGKAPMISSDRLARPLRIITFMLAALAGTATAAHAQTAPPKIPIRIGVIKITGITVIYAAQKLGYFAAQGLDATLTPATNGQVLLNGLGAGDLDFTLAIPGTAMQARDRAGQKVVLVLQNEVAHATPPDQGAVLARNDSGITSMSMLGGKTIGFLSIGNQYSATVLDVLAKHGVDPKSVKMVELPLAQMQGAMEKHQVDAVAALEPFVTIINDSKQTHVLSWNYTEAIPSQPVGAFWAMEDWANKNPATVKKFQTAVRQATQYLETHPAEKTQLTEEFTGIQSALLANLIPDLWTNKVIRSDWEKMMKMMVQQGLISPKLTFAEMVPANAMDPGR